MKTAQDVINNLRFYKWEETGSNDGVRIFKTDSLVKVVFPDGRTAEGRIESPEHDFRDETPVKDCNCLMCEAHRSAKR